MTGSEPDTIRLVLSPQERLARVATLVAGGLGGRLELPVDRIDDLQLAISTVLGRVDGDMVTVEFEPDERGVTCRLGPMADDVDAVLPTVTRLVSSAARTPRDGLLWVTMRLDVPEARIDTPGSGAADEAAG